MEQTLDARRLLVGRDWSVRAGGLQWSCLRTASYMADCLLAYAGQLIILPQDHYVEVRTRLTRRADATDALEFLDMAGRLMIEVLNAVSPGVRAYHPYGKADRSGFAAIACVEVYVHGWDICQGLGGDIHPDLLVCSRVMQRLLPDATVKPNDNPWTSMLYATGRLGLDKERPKAKMRHWQLAE
jgi:hypothetical protein